MTDTEYIKNRLDDQIKWYSEKSQSAQKWYKSLKIIEFIISASIPVITLIFWDCFFTRYIISTIGALLSFLTALHGLCKWHEQWIKYRRTAEALKREKFLYLTQSGPYSTANAESLLVVHCEQILAAENSLWALIHNNNPKCKV